RRSTAETRSTRRTRPCCGWDCRWPPPCSSSWSGRRWRITFGTSCTARGAVEKPHTAVLEALADESRHILEDGVVAEAADIDPCLLLGAGFPFWLGGDSEDPPP